MPTVLLINGYRFYFYLNEHEPIHVHVSKSGKEARIVLVPTVDVTYCRGFKKNELRDIIDIILERYDTLINAWRKPLVSNRLTNFLNQTDDEPVNLIEDEFDKLIDRENLRISRFVWVREIDLMLLILTNRRVISQALSAYPILNQASDEVLANYTISESGVHWPTLDADLSLRGLLMSEVVKGVTAA